MSFRGDESDIPDDEFKKAADLYEKINYYPAISLYEGIKRITVTLGEATS